MVGSAPDERTAEKRLDELRSIYGLPSGCELNETFLQQTTIGRLDLFMVGLVAVAPEGSSVTGAAADERGFPVDRAYFELIERLSIFLARARTEPLVVRDQRGAGKGKRAPARVFPADSKDASVRVSLSNGVALHASWPLASEAALCELVERDRVLRSFAGEYPPQSLDYRDPKLARALRKLYRIEAFAFGPKRKSRRIATGVFLFPEQSTDPLAYGFGAARSVDASLESAKREALQRLAFLWGEPLPAEPPAAEPTPDFHQEYYLFPRHHALLRAWLKGEHPRRARAPLSPPFDAQPVSFVDLSPDGLRGQLAVAKAVSARARVLRFGAARESAVPPHPIA